MEASNRRLWAALAGGLLAWLFWIHHGRALFRRAVFPPRTGSVAERVERRFLALLLPPITGSPRQYTMTEDDLDELLGGFSKLGYVSVSVEQISDFYRKGAALPRKSVLIALDRDQPESVRRADRQLRRHGFRGLVFLNKTKDTGAPGFRHALSGHHAVQLRRSGAWELGVAAQQDPGKDAEGLAAVLDDGRQHWTRNPSRFPVRFVESKSGYNDGAGRPAELSILRLRGERRPADNIQMVHALWPRLERFEDRFVDLGLGLDWVADWGVISAGNGRLALLPTPKQTSASVFLAGTEDWRDSVLEFDLAKAKKDFWAYARYHNGDRYVRLGLREGFWIVQQKIGGQQPVTLGKAPLLPGAMPATVRLIVKDEWIIVHVNGRMQFNKGLRINRAIDRGRFQLSVYDAQPKKALAVLTRAAASPLAQRWLALDLARAGWAGSIEPGFMEDIREQAAHSRAISPRWLEVRGGVMASTGTAHEFVRALAGFNRCLLVPLVDADSLPGDAAAVERLQRALAAEAAAMGVDGLNVRLSSASVEASAAFLDGLDRRLRLSQRRLWVTADAGLRPGWLKVSTSAANGTALLETHVPEQETRKERSRLWN